MMVPHYYLALCLVILSSDAQPHKALDGESPGDPRCQGRNLDKEKCCTEEHPCLGGEGDCDNNDECKDDLVCGDNNCKQFGDFYHEKDDCCVENKINKTMSITGSLSSNQFNKIGVVFPLSQPFPGQRCSGRNNQGRRCCTPEDPCGEGEGDCDGPGDGGLNDGHDGCQGDLECGSNNCKQFGSFYHEKDDCCQKPSNSSTVRPPPVIFPGSDLTPPVGQRCTGRNYQGRRCCTPEAPCDEGEGDCDGPGDGGDHDGHAGCKGDLVCGSNNCRKFGAYYHEKDDCCEKAEPTEDWGPWQSWSGCSKSCGVGKKTRDRFCSGPECSHAQQSQDRLCNTHTCPGVGLRVANAFLCVLLDWYC